MFHWDQFFLFEKNNCELEFELASLSAPYILIGSKRSEKKLLDLATLLHWSYNFPDLNLPIYLAYIYWPNNWLAYLWVFYIFMIRRLSHPKRIHWKIMLKTRSEDFSSINHKELQKINIYLDVHMQEFVWNRDKGIEIDRTIILMKG